MKIVTGGKWSEPVSPNVTWARGGVRNRPKKCHVLFEWPLILNFPMAAETCMMLREGKAQSFVMHLLIGERRELFIFHYANLYIQKVLGKNLRRSTFYLDMF